MFTERTKIDNISLIYGTENNHPKTAAGVVVNCSGRRRRPVDGWAVLKKQKKNPKILAPGDAVLFPPRPFSLPTVHVARSTSRATPDATEPHDRRSRPDSVVSPRFSPVPPFPVGDARHGGGVLAKITFRARPAVQAGPHARRRQIAVVPDANARTGPPRRPRGLSRHKSFRVPSRTCA